MYGWTDLGVIVLLDGFLDLRFLERDFVNRLLFCKQMIERKIIEQVKCRVTRRGVCYGVEPRGIYFGNTMLQGYYLT